MPQVQVVGYALQLSTNPPQQPGAPPVPFRVGVAVQLQPNGPCGCRSSNPNARAFNV